MSVAPAFPQDTQVSLPRIARPDHLRARDLNFGIQHLLAIGSSKPASGTETPWRAAGRIRGCCVDFGFDRAALTMVGQVAAQDHPVFLSCERVYEALACRADINVLSGYVSEVLLAEASLSLCVRGHGFGSVTVMPALSHSKISSLLK